MNRPIKFRAWEPEEKKMYRIGGLGFSGAPTVILQYNPIKKSLAEKIVLMQFTGLLHKNGKEVFEGDIIERWSYTSETMGRQDVERFPVKYYGDTGYPAFDLEGHDGEVNGLSELVESGEWEWEVIGNIYENPELIENK